MSILCGILFLIACSNEKKKEIALNTDSESEVKRIKQIIKNDDRLDILNYQSICDHRKNQVPSNNVIWQICIISWKSYLCKVYFEKLDDGSIDLDTGHARMLIYDPLIRDDNVLRIDRPLSQSEVQHFIKHCTDLEMYKKNNLVANEMFTIDSTIYIAEFYSTEHCLVSYGEGSASEHEKGLLSKWYDFIELLENASNLPLSK